MSTSADFFGGWQVVVERDADGRGERVHVVPVADALAHELRGDGCACGPEVERPPGSLPVAAHFSLDGREVGEAGEDEQEASG